MSGKKKHDTCCKCGQICKFRGGYKKIYPDEPVVVIDKGRYIYCMDCFYEYIDNQHKPVYRG